MDIFQKQQIVDSIKAIIKARWFFAATVFVQGIIVKVFFPNPLASTWQLAVILIVSYFYNIAYWLYVRRPPEKMTDLGIKAVKALQIIMDSLAISAILFFSGTVDKMIVVWYFVVLMIGVSLYKKRGIALSAFFCIFLYSSLLILEYYGFLIVPAGAKNFTTAYGNIELTLGNLIGFGTYMIAASFFAWFLGSLLRKREKRLQERTDQAVKQAQILAHQTQELTKTKDYLHEALVKSDKSRTELEKTKVSLEKINLELKAKLDEVEKYSEVTTGRELKMIELKDKIKSMEERMKELEEQIANK
ncbi:MAG: hypothetical protein A2Y98_01595 [Candidatus Portnoybacteria bacterium RBG_19FT_COMBO_36_7]|uniref:Uncharacterized protein n=1 Tax=Candidatus Portnoybacteria bacterium RBG_19FT_COMBO_36_7 TaxID=1801992 RepID=A0A1G2F7L5_9BACT|nr:MAG: hypothetical protein A2Y98_01595 [Candidatus Portnoybacteria bacterium RBG_19FT_COMBO_36_7]